MGSGWRAMACSLGLAATAIAASTGIYIGSRPVEAVADKTACAPGWRGPVAGSQSIAISDTSDDVAQVYLIDVANRVYAEARDIDPGTSRTIRTTLGPGRYALRCVFSNGVTLTSAVHTVTGRADGAVGGIVPLPDLDLEQPVRDYRAYVKEALPGLVADTRTLASDIAAADLSAARGAWLTAHLDYERLGAAYNSFGDFDGALDGDTEGLAGGRSDASWTGFFRLEYGLWHGQSAAMLKPIAKQLVTDVNGLVADFPSEDIDPADLPLRTHEILENALQFQVSGADDYGSGTTLATTYANTQGTLGVLGAIRPLLLARDPGLVAAIDAQIATVQGELLAARAGNAWTPATGLPRPRRQRLDADLGALLETLAIVPNLLQERTSA